MKYELSVYAIDLVSNQEGKYKLNFSNSLIGYATLDMSINEESVVKHKFSSKEIVGEQVCYIKLLRGSDMETLIKGKITLHFAQDSSKKVTIVNFDLPAYDGAELTPEIVGAQTLKLTYATFRKDQ